MRRSRRFSNTLLLICEGENSEPNYFEKLATLAKEKEVFDHIEIFPRPKNEDDEENDHQPKGSPRQRRQFQQGNQPVPERTVELADADELPFATITAGVQTWPTPVRYIKEARDRIKSGEFNEIWAIFDKDGHAHHARAFQLAEIPLEDKIVNIAFSSISFEHWVLLHFEKNNYAFQKSECKENKKSIGCGTGEHADDCWGAACVAGLIITNHYLPNYSKSATTDLFSEIGHLTDTAIANAAWLRMEQRAELAANQLWEINPITTIDVLVKKLLDNHAEITWTILDLPVEIGPIIFEITEAEADILLKITNHSNQNVTSNEITLIKNGLDAQPARYEPAALILPNETLLWALGPAAAIQQAKLIYGSHLVFFER